MDIQDFLAEQDINLQGLFEIINPENNLVSADDMMLSAADGTILRVSKSYEKNFGFAPGSIVGKSVFDLEKDGTFQPCITAQIIREKRKIMTVQTVNHINKNVLTVGIPLFDNQGKLKYAACFNTLSMEQINTIQRNYQRLQESVQQYSQELADLRAKNMAAADLLFKSPAMQKLLILMQNTANTRANILITGETGVGKSAIAKMIHKMSDFSTGPFIEVNCAVLHENLIESELFGYEKGAFTGASSGGKIGKIELANHGTLFLDEISEMPMSMQAKLLSVLQDRQFEHVGGTKNIALNTRIISASNANIQQRIEEDRFRADLFYRLNVISIEVLPLRDRMEDLPELLDAFLSKYNYRLHASVKGFDERVIQQFNRYSWPGNIRQLENIVEYCINMADADIVQLPDLPPHFLKEVEAEPLPALKEAEGGVIRDLLNKYGWDSRGKAQVAQTLGISVRTLYRKIDQSRLEK